LLSQENGPFLLREGAGMGPLHPRDAGDDHLLEHTIERRIEQLPAAIEQLKKEGIASGSPALEPERRLPIQKHALAIEGDPEAPAPGVRAQALQGGIQQQPVEQEGGIAGGASGADREELGCAGSGKGGGVFSQAMEPDLLQREGPLVRLSPGLGGIDGEQVAAWGEGGHLQLALHQGDRQLAI
jgi:hypothetical protein